MSLLIDGYNLLHVTDIFGKGTGPGGFQRSREALLRFLGASIPEAERKQTTVVFDAADAPPGLPNNLVLDEMLVRYATDYPDADTLIEELIEQHDSPRRLLVVSSDHRIQRAARRRRAKFTDSDIWFSRLVRQRDQSRTNQRDRLPEKPLGNLNSTEVDYWVNEFNVDEFNDNESIDNDSPNAEPQKPLLPEEPHPGYENPFPPGYGEDLLE